jgi:hypothetical protein
MAANYYEMDSRKENARKRVGKGVSRYGREQISYLRGLPKKVSVKISCKNERNEDLVKEFELNLDLLTCKTDYIDAEKRLQVIF